MHTNNYVHATTAEQAKHNLTEILHKHGLENRISLPDMEEFLSNNGSDAVLDVNEQYFKKVFALLIGVDEKALNEVVRAFADAWSWSPHKALKGKSPMGMLYDAIARGGMPSFIFGLFGMDHDDHDDMQPRGFPSPYMR